MATELKTRKYTKEQMVSYLEKHGSTLTEAANIAGTNTRTLGRYLSDGVIPSEWYAKITAALKDRKPAPKPIKAEIKTCSACGKKLTMVVGKDPTDYNVDSFGLEKLGKKPPASGWHWYTNTRTGTRTKMYPICEKCWNLLNAPKKRATIVKGKTAKK